jgi:NAD(P)-dependent dehydrogenase (short-subunit alcohol dehydrogenase family)
VWFSNAGVPGIPELDAPTAEWNRLWNLHVMAHVWAAQALVPEWSERGSGYLLQTASAAGLLMEPGTAAYTVTKHAAVGLGEWLAHNLRPRGIGVSCFCPFGVRTRMLAGTADQEGPGRALQGAVSAAAAAEAVIEGLEAERFLILSHPEAADEWLRRATDHEAWISDPWPPTF